MVTNPNSAAVTGPGDSVLADDVLLRPVQAAPLLGRSASSLAKDRMNGDGCPYVKVGRFALYRVGTVRQYVASCARRSTSGSAPLAQHAGA